MIAHVSCRGLVCSLGGRLVLDGVELELQPGESVALLGGSGSGKSTLLRIISGLDAPGRGEVLFDGRSASSDGRILIPPHQRKVAMVFQDLALWPNLTAQENVLLGIFGLRLPRRTALSRAEDAMRMCGVQELGGRLPATLSGGQQQRVALARALSMQPRLLLLDEPFGGLDLLTRHGIVHEIAELRRSLGFALLLVTHDLKDVRLLCDSVAVLEAGKVVDRGPLAEVTANPQSALARACARELMRNA